MLPKTTFHPSRVNDPARRADAQWKDFLTKVTCTDRKHSDFSTRCLLLWNRQELHGIVPFEFPKGQRHRKVKHLRRDMETLICSGSTLLPFPTLASSIHLQASPPSTYHNVVCPVSSGDRLKRTLGSETQPSITSKLSKEQCLHVLQEDCLPATLFVYRATWSKLSDILLLYLIQELLLKQL